MREILDIILKFQGILGATFGAVVVLITTSLLKYSGKTYIYFREWNIRYTKDDEAGGMMETPNSDGAIYGNYSFEIEIINTSEAPGALRDIKVKFYNGNQLLVDSIPDDESNRKVYTSGTILAPLKIINLPSRQMVYYKIDGYIKEKDLDNLSHYKKVYFEALNHGGKKIKKLIHKN